MEVILTTCFSIGSLISSILAIYFFKRYKDLVTITRRTNHYPLNLKQTKNYRLVTLDPIEHHILSLPDNTVRFKFKLISNQYNFRKFQVLNEVNEEVAILKKSKHWIFGRDHINITERNRYEVRSLPITTTAATESATDLDYTNIQSPISALSDVYCNLDSPPSSTLISPYIDPALYTNYETPQKSLRPMEIFTLNQDFKRIERRKLYKIKTIFNKKSNLSTAFKINKNSLEYKWIHGSLLKVSKNLETYPIIETLGIIDVPNTEDGKFIDVQLNTAQIEAIVGLLSLYLYLHQVDGYL